jgi:hypothetical protein
MKSKTSLEQMQSLRRYYDWCDLMKNNFVEVNQRLLVGTQETDRLCAQAYMCYWYAGLNVVIEGYKRLNLADDEIDHLLASSNFGLLEGFRHGVFHYQPKYNNDRFLKLVTQGENVRQWVSSLHAEFKRLLSAYSATLTPKRTGRPPGRKGETTGEVRTKGK